MKNEVSLQQPATGTYSEPNEINSRPHGLFNIHFNIIVQHTLVFPKRSLPFRLPE